MVINIYIHMIQKNKMENKELTKSTHWLSGSLDTTSKLQLDDLSDLAGVYFSVPTLSDL